MDKEANRPAAAAAYLPVEYSLDHHHQRQQPQEGGGGGGGSEHSIEMVDYMLMSNTPQPPPTPASQISLDKLSFAEVMQFADFGHRLHQSKVSDDDDDDENYFLKFHVLGDHHRLPEEEPLIAPPGPPPPPPPAASFVEDQEENASSEQHLHNSSIISGGGDGKAAAAAGVSDGMKPRRKRPRTMKTSEEVESQRMTHIAVERNRRRQMNDHLRVLRSLMPSSYVQRGDQASIIGGAIEFVRELEQLLQCLESQKRRRLFGGAAVEAPRPNVDAPNFLQQAPFYPSLPPFISGGDADHHHHHVNLPAADLDQTGSGGALREETAENKSCLADVEVRMLGVDAMIKILCHRRAGQLVKTIAALEDHLQLNILHTNITTIEQTVLYSFNVKITSEARCNAEDIANSVQQILTLIDANTI